MGLEPTTPCMPCGSIRLRRFVIDRLRSREVLVRWCARGRSFRCHPGEFGVDRQANGYPNGYPTLGSAQPTRQSARRSGSGTTPVHARRPTSGLVDWFGCQIGCQIFGTASSAAGVHRTSALGQRTLTQMASTRSVFRRPHRRSEARSHAVSPGRRPGRLRSSSVPARHHGRRMSPCVNWPLAKRRTHSFGHVSSSSWVSLRLSTVQSWSIANCSLSGVGSC